MFRFRLAEYSAAASSKEGSWEHWGAVDMSDLFEKAQLAQA